MSSGVLVRTSLPGVEGGELTFHFSVDGAKVHLGDQPPGDSGLVAVATAIRALRDEKWRRQGEREALAMAGDPADRAEVAETLRYLGDEE